MTVVEHPISSLEAGTQSDGARARGERAGRRSDARGARLCSAVLGLPLLVAVIIGCALAPAANAIDVMAPEAGITDPLASVAPLDRNCKQGQVDVNTATADQIGRAFGIESRPTLERVMAMRPWLKPLDLVSVPGVPPSAASVLRAYGCATPTELPMPTPRACRTGSAAVDVQSASAAAIGRDLDLPATVVRSLIAARPLPQDLHQVITPRVPGLSRPKLDALVEEHRLCVTPAVFTYAGTTWRWASEEHGAVVSDASDSRYALIVPARVVAGPTGAWGSITPDFDSTLATAAMHIYGSWTPEVGSRLPDPSDSSDARPVVEHVSAGGATAFSWGDSVATETGGTVVAPLTSLSTATTYDVGPLCSQHYVVQQYGHDDGSLYCAGDSPRDSAAPLLLNRRAAAVGRYVAAQPVPPPCEVRGRAVSSGGLPSSLSCRTSVTGDTATWTLKNDTGASWAAGIITAFGTVVHRAALGNHAYEPGSVHVDDRLYGIASGPAAKWLVQNAAVVLPATSIAISKRAGSGPSTFRNSLWMEEWKYYWTIFQILPIIDAGLDFANVTTLDTVEILTCLEKMIGNDSQQFGDVIECLKAWIDSQLSLFEQLAKNAGDTKLAGRFAMAKVVLGRVAMAPTIIDFGVSYVQQASAVLQGSADLTLEYLPVPPPVGGGEGPAANGTFIARTARGQGFLVDPRTSTANEIRNGGDFLCYASTRFVVDLVTKFKESGDEYLHLDPKAKVSADKASPCTPSTTGIWTYTAPPEGNTPFNVILREEGGSEVTSSWLINNRGQIQSIPDGGTYECLVYANPVIWNVPLEKARAWQEVGPDASCG